MALMLGIDTGGTYTDAVLVRDDREVVVKAKALTTRQDLSIGISAAISAVLNRSAVQVRDIRLVCLSTTLATNALVEGQGGRAGLVYIGFRQQDIAGHGLIDVLGDDPAVVLAGGHSHAGLEREQLDEAGLCRWLETHSGVSAYAVASQFSTRNPAHEQRAARIIREVTGRPVSCSHHLSAKLNGPKRALTAVLNARLIGMIARLIDRTEFTLQRLGLEAPLMVVRGDGALITADQARHRPIETILSGPAASIVGAQWLTGVKQALISDIGGTTTDIAVLQDGRPMIDPTGAKVGPWRTMVEAVAMRTTGLGGDSAVHVQDEGLQGGVTLGPARLVPVSLLAAEAPEIVHAHLDEQSRRSVPNEHDGRFVRAVPGAEADGLPDREQSLLQRIGDEIHPVGQVLRTRLEGQALTRLVVRGMVQMAGVTPSDASHVLGGMAEWDAEAAHAALELMARRRTGSGKRLCASAKALARMIVDQLTHQTCLGLLEVAFAEDNHEFGMPPEDLARHVLMQRGLARHRGFIRLDSGLNVPVVGLGASAAAYYPAVGQRLGANMILPEHADVANAIGAVVGQVAVRRSGTVTSPAEGRFRAHLESGPSDHHDAEAAMRALQESLEGAARAEAITAGVEDLQMEATRDVRSTNVDGREVFLEAVISVEATGRPRVAD